MEVIYMKEYQPGETKITMPEKDNDYIVNGAVNLINHFYQKGLMLPANSEHYVGLAEQGKLVVATNRYGSVIGTAAYTQSYERGIWEFGAWTVKEEYQKQGIGKKLLEELFSKKPHFKTIALANKNSSPILELLGADVIEDHSVLPDEVFELCSSCPVKPATGCCDTIFNLSPVVEKLGMPDISWMLPRQVERLVYGVGENQWGVFAGLGKDPEEWV
jgi:N-acetylglutamate synthase-like GNAT family acetyltransferase